MNESEMDDTWIFNERWMIYLFIYSPLMGWIALWLIFFSNQSKLKRQYILNWDKTNYTR